MDLLRPPTDRLIRWNVLLLTFWRSLPGFPQKTGVMLMDLLEFNGMDSVQMQLGRKMRILSRRIGQVVRI